MFQLILIFLGFLLQSTTSLVDNGILGDPYVSCGPDHIDVRFDTRNSFRGLVFVKDHLDEPECRSMPHDESNNNVGIGGSRNAQIRLKFRSCGLTRTRSADPRGIFVSTELIVAFHPEFLTKFDHVYIVQCYYMEMQNILEKEIQVNMPTPPLLTQQTPMPVCRYEVLNGGPEGPPVFFATIGQMVYHKWTCDSSTENQFCMVVHSCIVDDGNGDKVELIDEKGCARDKYLLQNLDYVSDLMVGKEAHVYKYADRQNMFFDCQITLNIKEPGQQYCDVPNCPDPPRRRRRLRKAAEMEEEIFVTNSEEAKFEEAIENSYIIQKDSILLKSDNWIQQNFRLTNMNLCMSPSGLSLISLLNIFMLFGSGICMRNAYTNFMN